MVSAPLNLMVLSDPSGTINSVDQQYIFISSYTLHCQDNRNTIIIEQSFFPFGTLLLANIRFVKAVCLINVFANAPVNHRSIVRSYSII